MTDDRSSTGLQPKVAAGLAYVAWWASGLLLWALERESPFVRFHARQSTIAFGTTFALWAGCWIGSFLLLIVSYTAFVVLQRVADVVLVGGLLLWLFCLWQAFRGRDFRLPVAGALAGRVASRP